MDELIEIKKIDKAINDLGIEILVPKNRLSLEASKKKMLKIFDSLSTAKGSKKFNPNKNALKKLGIKLEKSKNGLSVDFEGTKYLYKIKGKEKNIVKIKLTGSDVFDFKLANHLAGIKRKPKGYTWHHLDDYDPVTGICTMQLVETPIHVACIPHYGGVRILEIFLNFKYLTRRK
ncbi:MAG: HNH endonuclease [Kordia sp.]|uniref:HNH endonuclease signature motif containing protein n=1 Tax=Kordia sp. TaxID=1965332 RepID=UPI00385DCABE